MVAAANADESSRSRARLALRELCKAYWYPLYAYVRYRGHSCEDAQDLTQAFFSRIIETDGLCSVDPSRGRFRSYLLGAMKHFLANEWQRSRAQKRGGTAQIVDWDALDPESRYAAVREQEFDPEHLFDREWALQTVADALQTLAEEMVRAGKREQFEAMKGALTGADVSRAEIAKRLGMSEGAVKVAVHRLRQRYRALLRDAVAETVHDEADLEDEMRHLVAILRAS